jgi:CTP synthase (UTP-ammonia lyase)
MVARIALLGDMDLNVITHREIEAARQLFPIEIVTEWIATDHPSALQQVAASDALWLIPGSPYRNDAVAFAAITAARLSGQPFLGTCGGFQYAVVEYAVNVARVTGAVHAELEPDGEDAVVERLACSLVAQQRMVMATPGTRLAAICGAEPFVGFHYCNFGLADRYVTRLAEHGLVISATADDAGTEGIELSDHPFFIATLFQPQVGALAGKPLHPLLASFADVARNNRATASPG